MAYPFYYTYILCCADGTYYVGKTCDLQKRLAQHNGVIGGGARYTRSRRPVRLHYTEEYTTNSQALKREYQLKQLSHQEKEQLCVQHTSRPSK